MDAFRHSVWCRFLILFTWILKFIEIVSLLLQTVMPMFQFGLTADGFSFINFSPTVLHVWFLFWLCYLALFSSMLLSWISDTSLQIQLLWSVCTVSLTIYIADYQYIVDYHLNGVAHILSCMLCGLPVDYATLPSWLSSFGSVVKGAMPHLHFMEKMRTEVLQYFEAWSFDPEQFLKIVSCKQCLIKNLMN